jgi:hypothetical protein
MGALNGLVSDLDVGNLADGGYHRHSGGYINIGESIGYKEKDEWKKIK